MKMRVQRQGKGTRKAEAFISSSVGAGEQHHASNREADNG